MERRMDNYNGDRHEILNEIKRREAEKGKDHQQESKPIPPEIEKRLTPICMWIGKPCETLEKVKAERDDLARWKKEMLEVESMWDEQTVGKELGVPPGEIIRGKILEKIRELKEAAKEKPEMAELVEAVGDIIDLAYLEHCKRGGRWNPHYTLKQAVRIANAFVVVKKLEEK